MVESREFRQKCQEIRAQIHSEFEGDAKQASFVIRFWLKWRAERRIREEIRKISPSDYAI